jgi:hypothetical protein
MATWSVRKIVFESDKRGNAPDYKLPGGRMRTPHGVKSRFVRLRSISLSGFGRCPLGELS